MDEVPPWIECRAHPLCSRVDSWDTHGDVFKEFTDEDITVPLTLKSKQ